MEKIESTNSPQAPPSEGQKPAQTPSQPSLLKKELKHQNKPLLSNSQTAEAEGPHSADIKADSEILLPEARAPRTALKYFGQTESFQKTCQELLSSSDTLSERVYATHESEAGKYWNIFYKKNTTNFYKDRNYIEREFCLKELIEAKKEKRGKKEESGEICEEKKEAKIDKRFKLLEAGCGVGNTFFPLVRDFGEDLKVYGFDFSSNAIQYIKDSEKYSPADMEVEVKDLVKDEFTNYKEIDFLTLVFVLSAVSPENHLQVMKKMIATMASDSYLFFRDYGQFDLAQLRLAEKSRTKLKDNFYLKCDGTRCFYFSEDYLKDLFSQLEPLGVKVARLETHNRVVKNVKRDIEMKRVWIQAILYKK